jgi:hypothetical protein
MVFFTSEHVPRRALVEMLEALGLDFADSVQGFLELAREPLVVQA